MCEPSPFSPHDRDFHDLFRALGVFEDNLGLNSNITMRNNIEFPDPADYVDIHRRVGFHFGSLNVFSSISDKFLQLSREQKKDSGSSHSLTECHTVLSR